MIWRPTGSPGRRISGRRGSAAARWSRGSMGFSTISPRTIGTASGPSAPPCPRPAPAQSLALTLHELGTNAVKYGALSVPGGRVDVSWAVDQGNLTLCWSEAGGPPVRAPERQGFGTKVISSSVEGQLHGRAQFDWATGGLTCRLTIPGIDAERPAAASLTRDAGPAAATPRAVSAAGRRILVVENEALIAIEMKETLTALGFAVVGP